MKNHCKILALGGALLVSNFCNQTVARAQNEMASPMEMKGLIDANFDRLFIIHAAEGNMAEVMVGKLALQKSKTPAVRMVAQTIIKGHGDAQKDLLPHFKHLGMMAPKDPGVANKATYMMLAKLRGAAFDKAFMASQVGAHEATVTLFEHEIMGGKIDMIKSHATNKLPGILMHTAMIYDAAVKVGAPGIQLRPKPILDAEAGASMMKMKM
jgi:putative membrane protein